MVNIDAKDVVVSFWGIGPVYRAALKKTIAKYMKEFPEPFSFNILTDYVEDFQYLKEQTDKCLDILDINEQRKAYDWSFELEPIPEAKTDREYTEQFRNNLRHGKLFSYSLKRFVIPWMIEHNVTNFMIADTDVHIQMINQDIKTRQDYVDAFLTRNSLDNMPEFTEDTNYCIGSSIYQTKEPLNVEFFNDLKALHNIDKEVPEWFYVNDGPFRFYHFKSVDDLQYFFDVWNDTVKMAATDVKFDKTRGPVFLNDELFLAAIYSVLGIQVCPVNHIAINIRHRIEERYVMPTMGNFQLGNTYEEFLELNKDELIAYYTHIRWPDVIEELYGITNDQSSL